VSRCRHNGAAVRPRFHSPKWLGAISFGDRPPGIRSAFFSGAPAAKTIDHKEDGMKLHRLRWTGMLLLGVVSLAPVAAQAGSRYNGYRQPPGGYMDYGQSSGGYVGAPYRIYPDENRYGRSYYYEDPYTGIRDSHLSRLTALYDQYGHPPLVYMIDNRTGWVINTYAREHDQWCKVGSGLVTMGEFEGGRRGGYAMTRDWGGE
jgi:hypothetical protein